MFHICVVIMAGVHSSVPCKVDQMLDTVVGLLQSQLTSIVQAVHADAVRELEAVKFQASVCLQAQTLEMQQLQQHLAITLSSLSSLDRDYRALQEECAMKDLFISRLKDEVTELEDRLSPLPQGVLVHSLDSHSSQQHSESVGCSLVSAQNDDVAVCIDEGQLSCSAEEDDDTSVSVSGEESSYLELSDGHVCSLRSSSGVCLVEEIDPPDPVVDDVPEDAFNPQHDSDMIGSDIREDDVDESFDEMDQFLLIKHCVENDDGTYPPDTIEMWKTMLYEWGFYSDSHDSLD